jgi:hypothetical protein
MVKLALMLETLNISVILDLNLLTQLLDVVDLE